MSSIINFSGGRTSGLLLYGMLQDGLPEDTRVVFCNTGKEHEGTYEFVRECSTRWGVDIVWLEWTLERPKFKRVTFETASRNGEPFSALNAQRKFLPNVAMRFCTLEMKLKTEYRYARSLGWDAWDSYVGIRADEPKRVSKIRGRAGPDDRAEKCMPLVDAGITKDHVLQFWREQPFDLQVPEGLGNCDLCFLKGRETLQRVATPERVAWWAAEEEKRQATFVKHGVKYANLLSAPACGLDGAVEDCACTD